MRFRVQSSGATFTLYWRSQCIVFDVRTRNYSSRPAARGAQKLMKCGSSETYQQLGGILAKGTANEQG
jgi:hypothetical protein